MSHLPARSLRALAALGLLAALALAPGCARRDRPVESGNRDQILHRGLGHDLAGLDPHLATQAGDYDVLSALLEGLVAEDPVDLHPVPGVAERWEISADQLTYTFTLRANARWSNGDPVTATDFVQSWRRMLTPSLGADNAQLLFLLQGAQAFHQDQEDHQSDDQEVHGGAQDLADGELPHHEGLPVALGQHIAH